ncbi:MAG: hypothetical protein U0Z26_05310 [Anaerolineales bacterium]
MIHIIMTRKTTTSFFIFIVGLTITVIIGFAGLLGIDKTPDTWGRTRTVVFVFGILIMVFSVFYYRYFSQLTGFGFIKTIKDSVFYKYLFIFPIFILIVLVYVWFVSSGTWTVWNSPTRYYASLAQGFRYGNLFIPTKPDPLLAELKDPYDPSNWRGKVEVPMDISYYKGRYYLYWGAAPAVLLYMIQPFYSGRIGDLFLVFAFVCGIFLFQILILINVWERFFHQLPLWLLKISIWIIGLACPVTFMLGNFKGARIYEAAVTGGQFFLVVAIFLVFTTQNKYISLSRLFLAGVFLAFAVGSRLTLLFPIVFFVFMCLLRIVGTDEKPLTKFVNLFALGIPLLFGAGILAWYNWARFGSITESGLYYQLTGGFDIQKHYGELADLRYIPQNIYNYVFYPFALEKKIPFFFPRYAYDISIVPAIKIPDFYSGQWLTGILWTVPFVVFAVVPLTKLNLSVFRNKLEVNPEDNKKYLYSWMATLLAGITLISFIWMTFLVCHALFV